MSTANGVVETAAWDEHGFGNCVRIRHEHGLETFYAHLKSYTVKAGEKVKKGQVIGRVGKTGKSVTPHLRYEVLLNGQPVPQLRDYLPEGAH
ncbi:MAG: M23 family metallopeptidase [Tannerella sp.]|nr:M23 family metallopeptidase [Tannerella sp.]